MPGKRGRALTLIAVVLVLLAVTDLLKPLRLEGADTGLVFLGRRLDSATSAFVGPLVSVFLLVYAAGIWGLRSWAVPMAWIYAAYVTTNVVLFPFRTPQPPDAGWGYFAFGLAYTVLAIGGSIGAAVVLGRRSGRTSAIATTE
jgi:hypothetical protein